jgi:hypothetical protein
MKKKSNNQKGEITIGMLVTIILLVLGFVILLIFMFNVGGTGEMDRTVCHESVIYRATLPEVVQGYLPLKCQTNKICITHGMFTRGNCTEFEGEKGITTVRVSAGEKGEKEIARIYAQELFDCWTMMGEGKMSLFSNFWSDTYGLGSVYPSCVICSRFAFDKNNLAKGKIDLANVDVVNYMMTTKVPNKDQTYLAYISGENGLGEIDPFTTQPAIIGDAELKTQFEELQKSGVLDATMPFEDFKQIVQPGTSPVTSPAGATAEQIAEADRKYQEELDNKYKGVQSAILFMQISAPDGEEVLKNALGTLGTMAGIGAWNAPKGTFLTRSPGLRVTQMSIGGKPVSGFKPFSIGNNLKLTKFAKAGTLYAALAVSVGLFYQQYWAVPAKQSFTASKCGEVSVSSSAREGCSMVKVIQYNVSETKQYCSVIESTP